MIIIVVIVLVIAMVAFLSSLDLKEGWYPEPAQVCTTECQSNYPGCSQCISEYSPDGLKCESGFGPNVAPCVCNAMGCEWQGYDSPGSYSGKCHCKLGCHDCFDHCASGAARDSGIDCCAICRGMGFTDCISKENCPS